MFKGFKVTGMFSRVTSAISNRVEPNSYDAPIRHLANLVKEYEAASENWFASDSLGYLSPLNDARLKAILDRDDISESAATMITSLNDKLKKSNRIVIDAEQQTIHAGIKERMETLRSSVISLRLNAVDHDTDIEDLYKGWSTTLPKAQFTESMQWVARNLHNLITEQIEKFNKMEETYLSTGKTEIPDEIIQNRKIFTDMRTNLERSVYQDWDLQLNPNISPIDPKQGDELRT